MMSLCYRQTVSANPKPRRTSAHPRMEPLPVTRAGNVGVALGWRGEGDRMASLWIESHLGLARSTKLAALALALKIPKAQALGHLHLLWYWTLECREFGNLKGVDDAGIAFAAEWTGDPKAFVRALASCGWLDRSGKTYRVHDWPTYADRLLTDRLRKQGMSLDQARRALRESWEGRTVHRFPRNSAEVPKKSSEVPRTDLDLPTETDIDRPEPTVTVTDPPAASPPPPPPPNDPTLQVYVQTWIGAHPESKGKEGWVTGHLRPLLDARMSPEIAQRHLKDRKHADPWDAVKAAWAEALAPPKPEPNITQWDLDQRAKDEARWKRMGELDAAEKLRRSPK